ncbi:serine/threonine-protein phosphatase 4 regulatory subunit 2 [Culicoides brevitarsis]|uniref:serine/threonine-protein phosphatase 4 regulatory subunit 2 n=1 Tax=Culicoides brevitarsis TaxID=469753 RepID=UPI00307B58FE
MENAEEIQLVLERYSRLKPKEIPEALEEYMSFVAKTGDTVFKWPLVQHLFREKLMNVITEFHDSSPSITDLPHYPNVDPFNFDLMKKNLIERMESFCAAPFTIQRICELLTEPRKQYSRIDKFMRAIEKNILVVSTTEPGRQRHESENGESLDSTVNGDMMSSEGNLDVGSSEEEQNITDNPLPATENANGTETTTTTETPETTIDPLTADIEIPLEKLEPEVNVLTMENSDPIETTSEKTENVPETEETSTDATETATEQTAEEEKPEESAKREIEGDATDIPNDENASKKAKFEEDFETPTTEVPEQLLDTNAPPEENAASEPVESVSESPVIVAVETTEPVVAAETTAEVLEPQPTLILDAIDATTTPPDTTNDASLQPLPPIETIQAQETNMEPEPVTLAVEESVPVAEPETVEDSEMKVEETTPLVNAENKMQTDEIEETAANAMDIDECSADFTME